MNCQEVSQWFDLYRELPENDPVRTLLDEHMKHCESCARQLKYCVRNDGWSESWHPLEPKEKPLMPIKDIAQNVMVRIYEAESWRIPVADRVYSITDKFRKKVIAVISFFLALFTCSFLFNLLSEEDSGVKGLEGLQPVAMASGSDSMGLGYQLQIAVASISDPIMLKMGPIQTVPDYFMVLSLLGVIGTLLILNWFLRTES